MSTPTKHPPSRCPKQAHILISAGTVETWLGLIFSDSNQPPNCQTPQACQDGGLKWLDGTAFQTGAYFNLGMDFKSSDRCARTRYGKIDALSNSGCSNNQKAYLCQSICRVNPSFSNGLANYSILNHTCRPPIQHQHQQQLLRQQQQQRRRFQNVWLRLQQRITIKLKPIWLLSTLKEIKSGNFLPVLFVIYCKKEAEGDIQRSQQNNDNFMFDFVLVIRAWMKW